MTYRMISMIGLALLASACATKRQEMGEDIQRGRDVASQEINEGFRDALLTPAEDLNLKREPIPQILIDLEYAYGPRKDTKCSTIANEVVALTEVLGPDIDELARIERDRASEYGSEAAGFTLGTVEDATTSFIPFRSLVRRATGATAYEKRVRAAYQRGIMRRSYLKGIARAKACRPPAGPLPLPEKEDD